MINSNYAIVVDELRKAARESGIQLYRDAADCIEELVQMVEGKRQPLQKPPYNNNLGSQRSMFHSFVVGQTHWVPGYDTMTHCNWSARASQVGKKHGWIFTCCKETIDGVTGILITRVK